MKSTIALFRDLYKNLPPLFPPEIKKKMHHALTHLEQDNSLNLFEIEKTMIVFGYEAWPWNRAYREFFVLSESKVGEHFLLPKLTPDTEKRYHDFKSYGGTLRDLHSGRSAEFFSLEQRNNIREALVNIGPELHEFTDREVIGPEKAKYLNRVEEFIIIMGSIKKILEELKKVAKDEQDHPALAEEIRARVRSFEYGLCLLGPQINLEDLNKTPDFFDGRKQELIRMRGINIPGSFSLDA